MQTNETIEEALIRGIRTMCRSVRRHQREDERGYESDESYDSCLSFDSNISEPREELADYRIRINDSDAELIYQEIKKAGAAIGEFAQCFLTTDFDIVFEHSEDINISLVHDDIVLDELVVKTYDVVSSRHPIRISQYCIEDEQSFDYNDNGLQIIVNKCEVFNINEAKLISLNLYIHHFKIKF